MSDFGQGSVMVTFATIAEAAQNTQRTYQSLEQKLNDLHSFLQPMVASWTGSAAEQYQQKQQQWDDWHSRLTGSAQTDWPTAGSASAAASAPVLRPAGW